MQRIAADFNGDGRMDFALVGGDGWLSVPVAMSRGDGQFNITNANVGSELNGWARTPNVKVLARDFNGDGRADIALTGGAGWLSIPVAFSLGDGTFNVTNRAAGTFGGWASTPGARPVIGDFNGDGFGDIALVGVGGWASIPVAFGNPYGWTIANARRRASVRGRPPRTSPS